MISIHALCEEGDVDRADVPEGVVISIHALCEEGDRHRLTACCAALYFYPRPLRGGRQVTVGEMFGILGFLSTPSARRATAHALGLALFEEISIHALCEEGDRLSGGKP